MGTQKQPIASPTTRRRRSNGRILSQVADTFQVPGFVNAHCHAFQRALRGRTEGSDFWTWRDAMLDLAATVRVADVYADVYSELLDAGYTAVGEFHYLGLDEAHAAAAAAAEAGIEQVLLYVAYARGGIERFRQASISEYLEQLESLRAAGIRVGVAPHSVRACPRDWLEQLGAYAREHDLPLHIHADEQPREIEECLAEHGIRPIELLADTGCLGPRTTVVHVHKQGVTWDMFFTSLGFTLDDPSFAAITPAQTSLKLPDGTVLKTSPTETFKFYVNGVKVDGVASYSIHDLDRVLISFGSEYLRTRNWVQICIMGEYSRQKINELLYWLKRFAAPKQACVETQAA